jgi:hypothetical protein
MRAITAWCLLKAAKANAAQWGQPRYSQRGQAGIGHGAQRRRAGTPPPGAGQACLQDPVVSQQRQALRRGRQLHQQVDMLPSVVRQLPILCRGGHGRHVDVGARLDATQRAALA